MECGFCVALEESVVGVWLRSSLSTFVVLEAVHVMAIAMVFGTIAIVDLRLLGIPSTKRSFTALTGGLLKWTWGAFLLAVLTGALMFVATASIYFVNTAFRLKLAVLVLAGLNMFAFEFVTARSVAQWDRNSPVPMAGKMAGALSLLFWTSAIFLGRWIGYTKTLEFTASDFDFGIGSQFL